ncbi:glycosyltransferase family 2 protein [Actinomycetospora endophytica]|uniref:Glycosyltransferase family 2 protein n=1 Tax=Actinomycetospora endophytica TaxID=2291215 RepID=A0ABS8PEV4_9PSEU|nr:glycosyltransferase family 2 protein [Actinomycetospora endophytica]MCD2195926.1 glycosyltransferase family 2 protein [Actinomycetospora endophytica]
MIPVWLLVLGIVGLNFTVWGLVGLCRLVDDKVLGRWRRRRARRRAGDSGPAPVPVPPLATVAVLMPAYNEEVVIAESLAAITALVPADQVHVVSDGSTDRTVELAREAGVHVMSTTANVGKAGALTEAVERFDLVERFDYVLLLDADTRVRPGYFEAALPLFTDPGVAAVAGAVRSSWDPDRLSLMGKILVCHRQRIYALTQRLIKYGQTWRRLNATHIVPGFASMYRTRVLPQIDMNPPGLVIEDFNMTFELYRHKLGRVGFTMRAVAETQDPARLADYVRQTRRWSLGLWQTVRRLPPRPSLFGAMLTLLLFELVTAAVSFLLLPVLAVILVLPEITPAALTWPVEGPAYGFLSAHLNLPALLFGLLFPDFLLTCLVVVLERRARFLAAFLAFPLMRLIDSYLALRTFVPGMRRRSDGRWVSPARREVVEETVGAERVGRPRMVPLSVRSEVPAEPVEAVEGAEPLETVEAVEAVVPEQTSVRTPVSGA